MIYFKQFEEVEPDFHVGHVGDKGPEVDVVEVVEYLSERECTSEIDLEAGSLTTYFNYMIPG